MNIKDAGNLLLLSGGISSAVLIDRLKSISPRSLKAIFFNYFGLSSKELVSASNLARYYKVDLKVVNLSNIYGDMIIDFPDNFNKKDDFYIPYRNAVFIAHAAAYSYYLKYRNIVWGVSSTSSVYYSDCSAKFIEHQSSALYYGSNSYTKLVTPFVGLSKLQILCLAKRLKVPISLTWSCANNYECPCDRCFGCVERERNKECIESDDLCGECPNVNEIFGKFD